ncbi:MAG TPA: AraC family transcriptional regulator [Polyangia bacterium]|nr:AraC family transcriptional regulator [Polyangia bacterium]
MGAKAAGVGSLLAVAARPAVAALQARGLDPVPVLRAANLGPQALESLEYRLPHASVRTLWEDAAAAAGDRWFGMHVALSLAPGMYDLFDYMLSTPATVGDAIQRFTRYARLVYDHSNLHLIVEPLWGRIVRRVPVTAPQYDEFTLTLLFVRCRQSSGVAWRPEEVRFQHARSDDDGEPSRVFGSPVIFGAPESEIRLDASVLTLPQVSSDAKLQAVLARYADALLTSLPTRGSLLGRVSSAIARQMLDELPTLSSTARATGVPARTLQRHLAAEGATHSGMVDDVRRELALKHLGNASISITEIAYALHFTDPTAFHRAFRRWTGESPLQHRRRLFAI